MPRSRPSLSITLPKNFTYHLDDQHPSTPKSDPPLPPQPSPPANRHYCLKRRLRPPLASLFTDPLSSGSASNELPLPTTENLSTEAARWSPRRSGSRGLLSRPSQQHAFGSPRTPKARSHTTLDQWLHSRETGESIPRPASTSSLLSDSSGTSVGSLTSFPAADGSCTSPESEASIWGFPTVGESSHGKLGTSHDRAPRRPTLPTRAMIVHWTTEMDRHLWSVYLAYLQDPKNTPFKMLPGVAPPLGVCHRVAREARRSWPRSQTRKASTDSNAHDQDPTTNGISAPQPGPLMANIHDAILSRSNGQRTALWPKSGSSTRRRLRHLCKVQPVIAPHYQRLLQSRSPSPFSSSSRSFTRSVSQLSESMSPSQPTPKATFNTRDVQLSLTTSTADTMQPNGPLAQLASEQLEPDGLPKSFNEPPVPFASDISIPSDLDSSPQHVFSPIETPRLGSPFAFHTWGPSRSNQGLPRQCTMLPANGFATIRSELPRSLQASHQTSLHKRRAPFPLENDLSSRADSAEAREDMSQLPACFNHRRVKSRGLSERGSATQHPLQSLFNAPANHQETVAAHLDARVSPSETSGQESMAADTPVRTSTTSLDSPFMGISQRPNRKTIRQPLGLTLDDLNNGLSNQVATPEHNRTQSEISQSSVVGDSAQTPEAHLPGFGLHYPSSHN